MKRGRLLLVVGVIGGLAVMAQIGQEGRRATPTAQEVTLPPPPLLEERGASTVTPLEAEVRGLVGVREVRSVVSVDGIVYMEIDVLEGYAAQPFAEALLGLARGYGDVADFSVMLNDGVSVPTSFLWRDGAWNGVQMIQQATLVSATGAPPTMLPAPISVATRAIAPGNCSTAVAMGLSAVEAAQYGDLDRDNDGVACYGD